MHTRWPNSSVTHEYNDAPGPPWTGAPRPLDLVGPGAGARARGRGGPVPGPGRAELPAIICACPQLVRIHIVLVRVSRSVLQQQQQS